MVTLIFIYAILFGSFLNVCIYRIPRGQSIITPPSSCPNCGRRLSYLDMLPILGYIILRGRCKACGHKISPRYIAVESLTGLLISMLFIRYGLSVIFFWYSILTCILLVIAFIDYDTMIIPNGIVLFGLAAGLIKVSISFAIDLSRLGIGISRIHVPDGLVGFIAGGGIFLIIYFLSGGKMGGGDIKLMAVLGLWLGLRDILLTMLIAFNVGAVISLILIITKIKDRKDMIPFGPFIAIGAYATMLFGNYIIEWYISVFLY